MELLSEYLKENNTTRYQVAKRGNIAASTLANANKQPLESMTVRVLRAVGNTIGKSASSVLSDLELMEKLRITEKGKGNLQCQKPQTK